MNLPPTTSTEADDHAYACADLTREFRQGEIIANVFQHVYVHSEGSVREKTHPYVIVSSQDCDLLRHYEDASAHRETSINTILLYEVHPFQSLASLLGNTSYGSNEKKRVKKNNDERFQYLSEVPRDFDAMGIGIPEMVIDFRKFFSISPAELERQCSPQGEAKRRCRLEDVYREHLQTRMAFYLQRVGLPLPHNT
jgi:hypothetical protein